jgi:hypothetical protein
MFWGGVENTLFLRYPHIKKSQGVKSGDRGGHSTSWCKAITWRFSPNTSLRRSLTSIRRCARALSCAHRRPLNIPSQLILVVEMNGKLSESKFIQHLKICKAVHILVKKVRSQNHAIPAKCCPDTELFTRIRAFKVKGRWMPPIIYI